MVYVVLYIFHDSIRGIVANDNFYITFLHHGVWRADRKMVILVTELYRMKFLCMSVAYIFCLEKDTHDQSKFFYWLVFYPSHYQSPHVYVLGLKDIFETPLIY